MALECEVVRRMPTDGPASPDQELQPPQRQRYTEEIDIRRREGAGQVSRSYRCELAVAAGRRFKNAVHMRPAMTPIHYWRSITYLPSEAASLPPSPPGSATAVVRKLYVSGVHCEPRLRVNRRSETTFLFQRAAAGSATSVLTCRPNDALWFKSGVQRPPNGTLPFEFELRIADADSAAAPVSPPTTADSGAGADLGSAGDSDGGSATPGDGDSVSSESGSGSPL